MIIGVSETATALYRTDETVWDTIFFSYRKRTHFTRIHHVKYRDSCTIMIVGSDNIVTVIFPSSRICTCLDTGKGYGLLLLNSSYTATVIVLTIFLAVLGRASQGVMDSRMMQCSDWGGTSDWRNWRCVYNSFRGLPLDFILALPWMKSL